MMSKEIPHVCKTCKLAEWTLRKDGRPNQNKSGRCKWKPPVDGLPVPIYLEVPVANEIKWRHNAWIDYSESNPCRVWEPKE